MTIKLTQQELAEAISDYAEKKIGLRIKSDSVHVISVEGWDVSVHTVTAETASGNSGPG